MVLYKQVIIANLRANAKELKEIFHDCAEIITRNGGVIRSIENRGDRRLGYGIEDRRWGELVRHYEGKVVVSQFNASPSVFPELNMKLKNAFPILRYETFKIDDPIEKLINTRHSLQDLQRILKDPSQPLKKTGTEDLDGKVTDPSPFLSDLDDEEDKFERKLKNYTPEWKRDMTFKPDPPAHLMDK